MASYWGKYKDHIRLHFGDPQTGEVKCAYCGATLFDMQQVDAIVFAYGDEDMRFPPNAEADHVIPRSRGGADTFSNIVPACKTCNASKNNRLFGSEWTPKEYDEFVREEYLTQFQILAAHAAGRTISCPGFEHVIQWLENCDE